DAGARVVDEMQQRRTATDGGKLLTPSGPGRLSDIRSRVPRVTQTQRMRSRDLLLRRNGVLVDLGHEVVILWLSIGMPHRATLSANRPHSRWSGRVSQYSGPLWAGRNNGGWPP